MAATATTKTSIPSIPIFLKTESALNSTSIFISFIYIHFHTISIINIRIICWIRWIKMEGVRTGHGVRTGQIKSFSSYISANKKASQFSCMIYNNDIIQYLQNIKEITHVACMFCEWGGTDRTQFYGQRSIVQSSPYFFRTHWWLLFIWT